MSDAPGDVEAEELEGSGSYHEEIVAKMEKRENRD